MFRRTAQWIAYFIIVIALVCGLEVIGNLPVQSQSSLPLGTHLWLAMVCARFDDSNIRNSRSACCRVLGEHNDTSAWFRRLFSLCN